MASIVLEPATPIPADYKKMNNQEVGVAVNMICVDHTSCSIGDTIKVIWEIKTHSLHERDFIGMFEVDRDQNCTIQDMGHVTTMDGLLDSRIRGDTSVSGGQLQWFLREDLFNRCMLLVTKGL